MIPGVAVEDSEHAISPADARVALWRMSLIGI